MTLTILKFEHGWQDALLGLWCVKDGSSLDLRIGALWWVLSLAPLIASLPA